MNNVHEFTFEYIIAEGDMVAVLLRWFRSYDSLYVGQFFQLGTYRIANGKIVEGWIETE